MTRKQDSRARGRKFLIALGCAEAGARSRLRRLPGVSTDLARMRALFVDRLGWDLVVLKGLGETLNLDLTAAEIEQGLHNFARSAQPGGDDSVIFYFTGHGMNHGALHYLCTREFDAQRPSTGLETRRLCGLLPQSVRRLWIVLDVCRAGDGAAALCEAIARDRALFEGSVWFLAACGQTTALDQAFSQAFVKSAEKFVARGGCNSQADFVRSVQRHLGGERAPQQLVPSFYGTDGFDFFGQPARASTFVHGLMRPLAPTFARIGMSRLAGWAETRDRSLAKPGTSAPALAKSGPEARVGRGRSVHFGLLALLAAGAFALASRAPWRGARDFARVAEEPVQQGAGAGPAPTGEYTRDTVWFAGGVAARALTSEDARTDHARCLTLGVCAMPFFASPFADEVHATFAPRAAFALARREVSTAEFARFLARQRARTRVDTSSQENAQLLDRHGQVWLPLARAGAAQSLPLVIAGSGEIVPADPARALEPLTHVTFHGASAYCAAQGGRLPREDEWELAARGAGRFFPWGDAEPGDCSAAGFGRDQGGPCAQLGARALPVGTAKRDVSPDGVHDLGGNVSEWTSSVFDRDAPDRYRAGCARAQKEAGKCRVVRGGSFLDPAIFLRASTRSALDESAFWRGLGFRCAFDPAPR